MPDINVQGRDFTQPAVEGIAQVAGNINVNCRDITGPLIQVGYTQKLDATTPPTADDDEANTSTNGIFQVGSSWYDVVHGEAYTCLDASEGAAVWVKTTLDVSELHAVAVSGDYSHLVNKPTLGTAAALDTGTTANKVLKLNNSAQIPAVDGSLLTKLPVEFGIAVSDESTDLTTGTSKLTFRMPYAMTLTGVRASVGTAPTGANLIVDINEGGSSILSTKLRIDDGEKTSTTAGAAAVISDSELADDAEITVDIDQIGSSTAGKGLKIWLIGNRA